MDLETIHIGASLGAIAITGLVAHLGLKIRAELADFNGKVLNGQHELREDFNAKHHENTQNIAVHIAEDEQKFAAISRTLGRIDDKLERRLPLRGGRE